MEVEAHFSSFFGPQERSKGSELLRRDQVVISSASDTDVRAFIKSSSSCRVTLTAEEIASPSFVSACTCPQARKGALCKHVWAVLLKLEQNGADFLQGKTEALAPGAMHSPVNQARRAKEETYKAALKQKSKERNRELREKRKREDRAARVQDPVNVQASLDFFAQNGFPLGNLDLNGLLNARKLLSRVFHPDKGGSHEEVLELNAHFEVLQNYWTGGTR